MTKQCILFYVQYLQGVGHLYRAAAISKAMIAVGLDVHIVSGGVPVPWLDFGDANIHQLTPIKCRDGDFKDLITKDGQSLDDDIRNRRRDDLLAILDKVSPDAVIIEAFPFGRRQMRFELLPLLAACQKRIPEPKVICSVRDILQMSDKPGRVDEIVDTLSTHFDHVLVHGDPVLIPFDQTFPQTSSIAEAIAYTGIVVDKPGGISAEGHGDVLISAGGGATQSEVLLEAALNAYEHSSAKDRHWRLMAGPNLPDGEFERLTARAPGGISVERNRSDFKSLLSVCCVSVSQAGYNTVADILQAGCPSVLIPYAAKGETEQTLRASKLDAMGRAELIHQNDLTPVILASAIDTALSSQGISVIDIDLTGAETSASYIANWLNAG